MASLAFQITGTANYKDFKLKKFRLLNISNRDTTAITIDVVFGKDDNDGESSITNGIFILDGVTIPIGATLSLGPMDFSAITKDDLTDGLSEEDYTLLIGTANSAHVADVYIEY